MTYREYLANIALAVSCLVNALAFGRAGESLSARIGWSIRERGFWSRVWLPRVLREHFERATG